MFIDHSVRNSDGRIERNLAHMHGHLEDCNGRVIKVAYSTPPPHSTPTPPPTLRLTAPLGSI